MWMRKIVAQVIVERLLSSRKRQKSTKNGGIAEKQSCLGPEIVWMVAKW
jgi:hypothetical protein